MKKIFSEENIFTFVAVILATTVAVLFVIPFAAKFIPGTATTTTAKPTS